MISDFREQILGLDLLQAQTQNVWLTLANCLYVWMNILTASQDSSSDAILSLPSQLPNSVCL